MISHFSYFKMYVSRSSKQLLRCFHSFQPTFINLYHGFEHLEKTHGLKEGILKEDDKGVEGGLKDRNNLVDNV